MKFEIYELTEFNVDGKIDLQEKCGLFRIERSEDGRLILVCDSDYGLIDIDNPSPGKILDIEAALSFVLDIGIRKEKQLAYNGYYFGKKLIRHPQSEKIISQESFDGELLERINTITNGLYQSGDAIKEAEAMQITHILNIYNNARLLFPNFYEESYLSLMRILDALGGAVGRYSFAAFVANISPQLNREIYDKIAAIGSLNSRLQIAEDLFQTCITFVKRKKMTACETQMAALDQYGKFMFACFYSAYQYRSKFVHIGFPFPDIVKSTWGLETESGTAYLSAVLGTSRMKMYRPEGTEDGDLVDIHATISDPNEFQDFQEKYFLLLPTWHFLKRIVRAAIVNKINTYN